MVEKLALLGGKRTLPFGEGSRMLAQKSFAQAFAEYVGVKYALAVTSGTSALISSLHGVGVGCADEVIVPAFTWVASASAILRVNAIPIFADIDPKTFCLDPRDVEKKITDRTKAIMPVDFYGHPANIPEFMRIAEKNGLYIVEDAAQATGAEIDRKKVGSLAHIAAFSFSGKPLATSAAGGVLTTDDRLYYERACLTGQHPAFLSKEITIPELREWVPFGGWGDNHRPLGPQLREASENLLTLDERNDHRIENCKYLTKELSKVKGITPPYVAPGYKHVYHYYTCLYDEEYFGAPREKFVAALNAEGVLTHTYVCSANWLFYPDGRPIYARGLNKRAPFTKLDMYGRGCPFKCPFYGKDLDYENMFLPVTEEIVDREFNFIQAHLSLGREVAEKYVEAIHKVIDNIDTLRDYRGPLPAARW